MKRLTVLALVAGSLLLVGPSNDAGAARPCRPAARRFCVGVTHQPCAPSTARASIALRAPSLQEATTTYTGCGCAFYKYGQMQGYGLYYGIDYNPDCFTQHWVSMDGNFEFVSNDPCPTCPSAQCVAYEYSASVPPGNQLYKRGTKLDQKMKWNEKLVLTSGTGKFKDPSGAERTIEIEAKELADAKLLVRFAAGNTMCYAKLHVCRIESHEVGSNKAATVSDFAVGQEIEAPPENQKVIDVTDHVTIKDTNICRVKIGNTTYQVVTATSLPN